MNGYDSKEEALEALLERVFLIMEELYQSGFDTVHDSTLAELGKVQELVGQYGMGYLAGLLGELLEGVGMRRHRIGGGTADEMGKVYTQISEYLYLGMEKIGYDRGMEYYGEGIGQEIATEGCSESDA